MIGSIKGIKLFKPQKANIAFIKPSKTASTLANAVKKAGECVDNVEKIAQINKAIENNSRTTQGSEDFLKVFNFFKKK